MADLNYIESGYFDPDYGYYVYTADAAADVNSAFTIDCTISHIEGADLFAFTNASLTASGDRIRNVLADLGGSAGFVCNTDGGMIQTATADLSSAFSSTTTADRIKSASADISAAFSSSSVVTLIKTVELFAASEATIAIVVAKISEINALLASNFSAAIDAARTRSLTAEASALVSLSALSSRSRDNQAALAAAFSLTATISHIEGADITAFTNAALTASARVTRGLTAAISDAFAIEASITLTDAAWRSGMWIYGAATESSVGAPITTASNTDFIYSLSHTTSGTSTTIGIVKRNIITGVIDNWATTFDARNNTNNGINRPDLVVLGTDLYISSNRLNNLFLEKLNSAGTSQWKVRISQAGYDSYTVTDGTDIYVSSNENTNPRSIRISKFNTAGTQLWSKLISPASGWTANINYAKERNGYIYVTYSETNTTSGAEIVLLAKMSQAGTIAWIKQLPSDYDYYHKVDIDYDDNIWLFCSINATPLSDNSYVVKFNSSGSELWTRKFFAAAVADTVIDTDNNIYATTGNCIFSLDTSGEERWIRNTNYPITVREPYSWGINFGSLLISGQHILVSGNASYSYRNASDNSQTSSGYAYDMTIRVPKLTGGEFASGTRLNNTWSYTSSISSVIDITTITGASLTTVTRTLSTASSSATQLSTAFTAITPGNYKWLYVVDAFGNFVSTATQTTAARRLRGAQAALTASFSQSTLAQRRRGVQATITSTASVISGVSYRINNAADLNAAFSQTAAITNRRGILIEASAQAELTASTRRTRRVSAALSSTASLSASITRTRSATTNFQAVAINLTVAVKQAFFGSELTAFTSMSVIGSKLLVSPLFLTANATISAEPDNRLRSPTLSLSTTATVTANTANAKITQVTADLTAISSVTASAQLTAQPSISLATQSQLITLGQALVIIEADLSAEATVAATVGYVTNAEIIMQAAGFIIAVGDRLIIDPALELKIEPETRYLVILPEDRNLIIESETRTMIILEETRLMLIEDSTGVNTIIKG